MFLVCLFLRSYKCVECISSSYNICKVDLKIYFEQCFIYIHFCLLVCINTAPTCCSGEQYQTNCIMLPASEQNGIFCSIALLVVKMSTGWLFNFLSILFSLDFAPMADIYCDTSMFLNYPCKSSRLPSTRATPFVVEGAWSVYVRVKFSAVPVTRACRSHPPEQEVHSARAPVLQVWCWQRDAWPARSDTPACRASEPAGSSSRKIPTRTELLAGWTTSRSGRDGESKAVKKRETEVGSSFSLLGKF